MHTEFFDCLQWLQGLFRSHFIFLLRHSTQERAGLRRFRTGFEPVGSVIMPNILNQILQSVYYHASRWSLLNETARRIS